jgi:formamidopyrimidine-DNA glycosylase
MPELPEVETIRRGLESKIIGLKIVSFDVRDKKVVQVGPEEIVNSKIKDIRRRAKMLIFDLDNEKSLLFHLKMTGQLIWSSQREIPLRGRAVQGMTDNKKGRPYLDWVAQLPNVYTRAVFTFDDKSALFFNDLRRFGYLKLYSTSELDKIKELKDIGPEPFDPRSGQVSSEFTVDYLKSQALKKLNWKIKQFITDQTIIAGVGNIYVDEALYYAGIMPTRLIKDISDEEWQKIHSGIIKALEIGLKYGGSSADTYVDAFGNQGEAHEHVNVYRCTGQPCPKKCGGVVKRIVIGGRGTHYCPECQK